jgi:hypothetical protein
MQPENTTPAAEPLRIGTERQLFVDDYLIDASYNLRPVLQQVRKYPGNPILRAKTPAEGGAINLYGTVLRSPDDGLLMMWYQGYGHQAYHALYATSRDGIFWDRPNLGLIEYAGSRANNLLSTNLALVNVIDEPAATDPQRRYKSLYYARLGQRHAANVCVAFSPDGVRWTPYADNPVLTGTSDTHTLLGWDERCGRYVAYVRPGIRQSASQVRVIGRSESEDFVHWTTPVPVLQPDDQDPPGLEFYGMSVFKQAGIYFGLLWAYHSYTEEPFVRMGAEVDVQLAVSRDGVQWRRIGDRRPFIPLGRPGSFDAKMIYTANAPLTMGDELWFYYGGWDADHGEAERLGSLGLAKLRLDGFVSLEPGDGEGWLVTRPFVCDGTRLTVNAEGSAGYLAVAVLGPDGEHLPGFRRIDSALVDGNGVRQPVTWREHDSLAALQGQTIRLKFYLRQARLYGFQVA